MTGVAPRAIKAQTIGGPELTPGRNPARWPVEKLKSLETAKLVNITAGYPDKAPGYLKAVVSLFLTLFFFILTLLEEP